jgi:peroxiredoxin
MDVPRAYSSDCVDVIERDSQEMLLDIRGPSWSSVLTCTPCPTIMWIPRSCGFRDHYAELRSLGASAVFGLSTRTPDYQREVVERLHLPFPLLSDSALVFTRRLRLPTFEFEPYRNESSTHQFLSPSCLEWPTCVSRI